MRLNKELPLSRHEEALLVAAYFWGGDASDDRWTSNTDQILTLSLFFTGDISADDCAARLVQKSYVRRLYNADGALVSEIEERYETLLRLLATRPDLIHGGGFRNPPPHPTYTACRLTQAGLIAAITLISKFPQQPEFPNWPHRRTRPAG